MPFTLRDTRKRKTCPSCSPRRALPASAFSIRVTGMLQSWCRSCTRDAVRAYRARAR